jgi:hypothetical protein
MGWPVVDLKFAGLTDYATADPARLKSELQRQNMAVRDAFARAGLLFEPLPIERVAIGTVDATFGEALICDTTNADVTVRGPEIRPGDSGKFVDLVHIRTGSTLRFRPFGNQLVQGAASYAIGSIGYVRLRAYGGTWMVQI